MIQHCCVLLIILLSLLTSVAFESLAQPQDSVRMFLTAGIGMPSGPQTFYDFWNPGISIGGGIRKAWLPEYYYGFQAEVAIFSLNNERYVKTLKLPSGSATVGGGTSTIVTLAGIFGTTTTNPNEYVQVSGDLGAGMLLSFVSASTGTFSGFSREAPGISFGALILTGAGRAELTTFGPWHVALEGRVRLGITGNKLANTDFSSLRIYLSRAMRR